MAKYTEIQNLKINKMTQEQYDALVEQGLASDSEIYLTPDDGGVSLKLLEELANSEIRDIQSDEYKTALEQLNELTADGE